MDYISVVVVVSIGRGFTWQKQRVNNERIWRKQNSKTTDLVK